MQELQYVMGLRKKVVDGEADRSDEEGDAMEILASSIVMADEEEEEDSEVWQRVQLAKEAFERERQCLHIRKMLLNDEIKDYSREVGWGEWLASWVW